MPTAACEWPIWSTTATLVVSNQFENQPLPLAAARTVTDAVLAEVDRAASRFRADSELNRLASDFSGGAHVTETLAALVRAALDAAALTDGDVDPTLGNALRLLGYDRDIALVTDDPRPVLAVHSSVPGWKSVGLTGNQLSLPAHLAFDLGATAKAVAADWATTRVATELGSPAAHAAPIRCRPRAPQRGPARDRLYSRSYGVAPG